MVYRGSSSDERLRAARAAARERDQLMRVLAELAADLEIEETRAAELDRLLDDQVASVGRYEKGLWAFLYGIVADGTTRLTREQEEAALVEVAHHQAETACAELRVQIARLTAHRESLAATARDLPDARAERTATVAHTPHGKAALELIVHLGELDSKTHQIAAAIKTGLLLVGSIREDLMADGVTPTDLRDASDSDTSYGAQMRRWLANLRANLGIVRADVAVFRRQLAALGIEFDPAFPRIPEGSARYLLIEPSHETVASLWGPISGLSTDVATQVGMLRKRGADLATEITSVEDECDRLLLST